MSRRLTRPAAVAAVAACLWAVAGCGGGGGDASSNSATAPVTVGQVTVPHMPSVPGRGAAPSGAGTGTTHAPPPPSSGQFRRALEPFRACLSRHGVQPVNLDGASRGQFRQRRDPAQVRKAIQARIACIPELPPRMRAYARRLLHRFQQRGR